MEVKDIENLKRSLKSKDNPSQQKGLSTGSTLLNLACSGDPSYGLLPGHIYLLVGDSNAGKTWIAHSIFAEAANSPIYSKYRLIYDNPEDGALMDIERYFGKNTAKRIEPYHSETVEAFYYHIDKLKDAPFVYVLDSMDALSSESEESKFEEQRKAAEKGKETSGSYGTAKAKANAAGCRLALARIKKIGSIVIIICQTRANLGFGSQFNPKTRSGGLALQFYATIEMWLSIKERLRGRILGKDRQQGILSRIQVKRTRITGREHTVEVPIYHSCGIDEIGSCVDWLVEEKHWKESKGIISAKEFGCHKSREDIVKVIEGKGQENQLRELVATVWREIDTACEIKRKPRYT